MPTERIAMRRVRELLRLRLDAGLSGQEAAARLGVARSTLREMLRRFGDCQEFRVWPGESWTKRDQSERSARKQSLHPDLLLNSQVARYARIRSPLTQFNRSGAHLLLNGSAPPPAIV